MTVHSELRFSLVVPIYNEEENVQNLLLEVPDTLLVPPDELFDEVASRFGFRRQFDTGLGVAHAAIEPEHPRSCPDQFSRTGP